MKKAFISYVKEDKEVVGLLKKVLEANGIRGFLDRDNLVPGERWKFALESAIRQGFFFLSVYSSARSLRSVSYVNEETVVAIEEIRKRPVSEKFFIPIKIDECEIEDRPIGGGESLRDLQFCDLKDWSDGIARLLRAMGVANPVMVSGPPLAPGVPAFVRFVGGHTTYDAISGGAPFLQGIRFEVAGGWCQRLDEGQIVAYLELVAPFSSLQTANHLLGLNGQYAVCQSETISTDFSKPTQFLSSRDFVLPAGTVFPDLVAGGQVTLPIPIETHSEMEAYGYIEGKIFRANFTGSIEFRFPGNPIKTIMSGRTEVELSDELQLPS